MTGINALRSAILKMHACASTHLTTVYVVERFKNTVAWQGEVEVFELIGHPKADRCFAWVYHDDKGRTHHAAVLQIPPVHSANDAVKSAFAAKTNGVKKT